MTRETKVGLVVAGSFLCLVCIVVASKIRRGDEPTPGTEEPSSFAENSSKPPQPPQPDPKKESPKKHGENNVTTGTISPDSNSGAPKNAPDLKIHSQPGDAAAEKQRQLELLLAQNAPPAASPAPPALPSAPATPPLPPLNAITSPTTPVLPASGNTGIVDLPPPAQSATMPSPNPFSLTDVPTPVPLPVPAPSKKERESGLPPVSKQGAPDALPGLPGLPSNPSVEVAQLPPPVKSDVRLQDPPPLPAPVGPSVPRDNFPNGNDAPPPPLGPVPSKDGKKEQQPPPFGPPPVIPPTPARSEAPGLQLPPPKQNNVPPPPVPGIAPPPTPAPSIAPAPTPGIVPLPTPGFAPPPTPGFAPPPTPGFAPTPAPTPGFAPPPGNTPTPPPNFTPTPVPSIPPQNLPNLPPITIGPQNPPQPQTPTLPKITIGSPPAVQITDPDVVRVAQGQTNFAQLSVQFYNTDKYADALLAYNQAHAGAVTNGAAFALNPPRLDPGQQVLKPPFSLLERDYPQLIRGVAPTPTPQPIAPPPPGVNLSRPSPIPSNLTPVSNPPAGSGRTYVVQAASGERLRDIAETQLGDATRWTQIYRLNPTYQPQFPIPAGTKLQLP